MHRLSWFALLLAFAAVLVASQPAQPKQEQQQQLVPTLSDVTTEIQHVQEYMVHLDRLRAHMERKEAKKEEKEKVTDEQSKDAAGEAGLEPTLADLDREQATGRDYLLYLQHLMDRIESGEKLDPADFQTAAASSPSDRYEPARRRRTRDASSDSSFRSSQDGDDADQPAKDEDAPPTVAEITEEEQLVNRYLTHLAKLRTKVEAGQKSTEQEPLPTLAELAEEERASKEYLAALQKLKKKIQEDPEFAKAIKLGPPATPTPAPGRPTPRAFSTASEELPADIDRFVAVDLSCTYPNDPTCTREWTSQEANTLLEAQRMQQLEWQLRMQASEEAQLRDQYQRQQWREETQQPEQQWQNEQMNQMWERR